MRQMDEQYNLLPVDSSTFPFEKEQLYRSIVVVVYFSKHYERITYKKSPF